MQFSSASWGLSPSTPGDMSRSCRAEPVKMNVVAVTLWVHFSSRVVVFNIIRFSQSTAVFWVPSFSLAIPSPSRCSAGQWTAGWQTRIICVTRKHSRGNDRFQKGFYCRWNTVNRWRTIFVDLTKRSITWKNFWLHYKMSKRRFKKNFRRLDQDSTK